LQEGLTVRAHLVGNHLGRFLVGLGPFELQNAALQSAPDRLIYDPGALDLPSGPARLVFDFKCHE